MVLVEIETPSSFRTASRIAAMPVVVGWIHFWSSCLPPVDGCCLRAVLSGTNDQVHFLEDQFAVALDLFHLSLFREQTLPLGPCGLLGSPGFLDFDLVAAIRIGCI